jgi:outer membrane lipoprotein SlyB
MNARLAAVALLPVFLASACVTTRTTVRTWGESDTEPERWGRVEQIKEVVTTRQGDPAAGAVAGAIIGGLLGSAIGGHTHYDRYGRGYSSGNPAGAVVGAVGGAMVGAAASEGGEERRSYHLLIRFDDGGREWFVYHGAAPFQVGENVRLTPRGLSR